MTNRKPTKTRNRKPTQPDRATARAALGPRRFLLVGAAIVVLVGLAVWLTVSVGVSSRVPTSPNAVTPGGAFSGPPGPEGIPLEVGSLLAPASTSATGQTVDSIQCDASEQVAYHVHTHLAV